MAKYNKAIGALVGGLMGFGVSKFGLPAEMQDPEIVGAITTLLSLAMVYIFPKNAD